MFAHKGISFIEGAGCVGSIGGLNDGFVTTREAFSALSNPVDDEVAKKAPEHVRRVVGAVRIPIGAKGVAGAH